MRPTTRLRFVEREVGTPERGKIVVRVLQQWFEREPNTPYGPDGEWRDVPMEVGK